MDLQNGAPAYEIEAVGISTGATAKVCVVPFPHVNEGVTWIFPEPEPTVTVTIPEVPPPV